MSSVGVHELVTFASMVAVFCGGSFLFRLPTGISMIVAAVMGAIVGGAAFPLADLARHLVEGMFAYLDAILVIATATIFMFALERNGLLGSLAHWTVRTFRHRPFLLLGALTLVIMFPGMITGSTTAAVLTTGALVSPVLMHMGIPRAKAGAIIALVVMYAMVAPPVNIPGLIIGAGVDMPYVGMDFPLLLMTVIPALLCTWCLGLPHCRKGPEASESDLPPVPQRAHGAKLFLPLVVVVVLLLAERAVPGKLEIGLPLIFMIGAGLACFVGERFSILDASRSAVKTTLPVLGLLMGVGMFIQIMTLTGARGEIVVQMLRLPRGWLGLYPAIGTAMPLFGAISAFGAASVMGVPFVLALPTSAKVIVMNTASLSVIASLGDLVPPTALSVVFAAQVVGEPDYKRVLRYCIVPGILTAIMGLLAIQFAEPLSRYLVFLGGDAP